MDDENTVVIGAFQGSRLIGFCVASIDEETHVYLLAVKPRFRRHGVASALLMWVRESSITCGASKMVVELRIHNEDALRLYRRLGFELIEEIAGYYDGPVSYTHLTLPTNREV